LSQLTKICSKCRIEKPLQDFHKDITAVLGHKPSCKECTKKYSADYAIRKSEELKARQKKVAEKKKELNREKIEKAKKERDEYWNNLKTRKCARCGVEKDISNFPSRGDRPDRYRATCRGCLQKQQRAYNQKYWEKNKSILTEKNKQCREINKNKYKKTRREYYENNKEKLNEKNLEYLKKRKTEDESFKLKCNIKRRMLIALQKQSASKSDTTFNLSGMTGGELYLYLKSLGYNSEIHHIDHIIPLAKFDLTNTEHQQVAFYYLNLQPLTVKENHLKKDLLTTGWENKVLEICKIRNINPEPIIKHIQSGKNDN